MTVNAPNAEIIVTGDLDIDTRPYFGGSGGDALSIVGDGMLSFRLDPAGSAYLKGEQSGLAVRSTGDVGGASGGIDIDADGVFRGHYGIYAWAIGSTGDVGVHLTGGYAVGDGAGAMGIVAGRIGRDGDLTVSTASGSKVDAYHNGIYAISTSRTGETNITVDGEVVVQTGSAILARSFGDLNVVTGATSSLVGVTGIRSYITGTGNGHVEVGGTIETLRGAYGVGLYGGSQAGNLTVVTHAGSRITTDTGVGISSRGGGTLTADIGGYLLPNMTTTTAVRVHSRSAFEAADIVITTRQGSWVNGRSNGIWALNQSQGGSTVVRTGDDVWGQNGIAIQALASGQAGDVTVETNSAANRSVKGAKYGILVENKGQGATDVVIRNRVQATGTPLGGGAYNYASGMSAVMIKNSDNAKALRVSIASTGILRGYFRALSAYNWSSGPTSISVDGDLSSGRTGIHAVAIGPKGALEITTGAGSAIRAGHSGIAAFASNQNPVSIDVGGEVSGTNRVGIEVSNPTGQSTVIVRQGGSVASANGNGIQIEGQSRVILEGQVSAPNGAAVLLGNTDDLVELRPGWAVQGAVRARGGRDTLLLGDPCPRGLSGSSTLARPT